MHNLISNPALYLAATLCSLSPLCLADTVFLLNGDKISGEIKEFNDQDLIIKTSYAPKIAIQRSAILSLEVSTPKPWSVGRSIQDISIQASEQHGMVLINHQQTPVDELRFSQHYADSAWNYNGSVETTLDVTKHKKNSQKLHVKGDITAETLQWRHTIKTEVRYETEDDLTKRNTLEGHYSLDYLINEHWLLRQEDFYQEDKLGTDTHSFYAALGPGYRFWGAGRDKLDFVVTYNHFWLGQQSFKLELNAWAASLNYKQYWFDGILESYADLQIAFPDIPAIDYISNSTLGLKYLLTQRIYLSFKYDFNDTKTVIGNTRDTSYTLGLGVNF
ncbi:DUF481 domain-containing protein [Shewanella baltica]|uniref:DUF481 domain-containing protein n=1 Tax=Shewanella baltica TaxID=62322 RepID=UPI00217EF19B|nr:DUF481 domain-containing protein [Shewanella baltica]MCS6192681.1 DUF481 domain-containing protein [Shewanella baltica]